MNVSNTGGVFCTINFLTMPESFKYVSLLFSSLLFSSLPLTCLIAILIFLRNNRQPRTVCKLSDVYRR